MKVKHLKTKTAGTLAAHALAAVTVVPASKLARFTYKHWDAVQADIQVRYIKAHLDELTPQEKYEAMCLFTDELAWVSDPILEATLTLCRWRSSAGVTDYIRKAQRFGEAYTMLTQLGVQLLPHHQEYFREAEVTLHGNSLSY